MHVIDKNKHENSRTKYLECSISFFVTITSYLLLAFSLVSLLLVRTKGMHKFGKLMPISRLLMLHIKTVYGLFQKNFCPRQNKSLSSHGGGLRGTCRSHGISIPSAISSKSEFISSTLDSIILRSKYCLMKLDLWMTSFHLMYFCNNISFYIISIRSITICPIEYFIVHTLHVFCMNLAMYFNIVVEQFHFTV